MFDYQHVIRGNPAKARLTSTKSSTNFDYFGLNFD